MNPYLISVLLGIVEGLTEFLPVSSTAHLRIAEALLQLNMADPYWKMYTIVIQLGAILALCLLFMGRIMEFIRTFPSGENGNKNFLTHPISLTLLAFVFTSGPSLLLKKLIDKNLESLQLIALALLIGGVVMWIIDAWSVRHEGSVKDVEEMNMFQAVFIGTCQTWCAFSFRCWLSRQAAGMILPVPSGCDHCGILCTYGVVSNPANFRRSRSTSESSCRRLLQSAFTIFVRSLVVASTPL